MLHASQKLLLSLTNHFYPVQAGKELRITVIALFKGGRGILTAEGKASTASVASMTSSPFQGIEQFNEIAVKSESWIFTVPPKQPSEDSS